MESSFSELELRAGVDDSIAGDGEATGTGLAGTLVACDRAVCTGISRTKMMRNNFITVPFFTSLV